VTARDSRNGDEEGEALAGKVHGGSGQMEGAERVTEVTRSETAAEIIMGAAASNDWINPAS